MLKDRLLRSIVEYIDTKNIKDILDLSEDYSLEFLAQGEYNINYTIKSDNRRWVFRVNTASQLELENQIEYEYKALKILEQSGVTPRGIYVDGSKSTMDYGVLIMEYLDGRPLDYNRDLGNAAEIFANIHSIDVKDHRSDLIVEDRPLRDRIVEGERWLSEYMMSSKVDKRTKEIFEKLLDYCKNNLYREEYFLENPWMAINNTEVNSHNFIIGKDKSYLIDWEKPVISDPSQDITQFLAETTTLWKQDYVLSREEKREFFKTYKKSLSTRYSNIEERVNIYKPYLYLRALSWCAYAYLEYQKPEKEIVNLDTLKKVEEYLEVDFMHSILKEYIVI